MTLLVCLYYACYWSGAKAYLKDNECMIWVYYYRTFIESLKYDHDASSTILIEAVKEGLVIIDDSRRRVYTACNGEGYHN